MVAERAGADCALKRALQPRRFVRPPGWDQRSTLCSQHKEPRNIPGPNSNSNAWRNWMKLAAIDSCNTDYP